MVFTEPASPHGDDDDDHGNHDADNDADEEVNLPLQVGQTSLGGTGEFRKTTEHRKIAGADDNANSRAGNAMSTCQTNTCGFKEVVVGLFKLAEAMAVQSAVNSQSIAQCSCRA